MSQIVYLYGFVPRDAELPSSGLLGMADAEVEVKQVGDIAAVVSRVPADTYAADALEARLDDLEWVGEQGLRHEQVVAWFVDHVRILPVRLFTLYSSAEALATELRERGAELSDRLDRVGDRREWDVKVAYDAERLAERLSSVSDAVAELDARIADATPGKRFLLERKRRELASRELADTARRLASGLLESLESHVVDTRVLELPKEEAGARPVVMSAALLVERDAEADLREAVRGRAAELRDVGVRVDVAGPWAPYRFIGEEHGEDR